MTSTIKRRPRGYRTGISREVFEFVMKLLRDTLGTTGRYLDLMRINAPLRIQGPGYRGLVDRSFNEWVPVPLPPGPRVPRQFYRWREYKTNPMHFQCVGGSASGTTRHVQHQEYRQHIDSHYYNHPFVPVRYLDMVGSLVPFRHTYNATRII